MSVFQVFGMLELPNNMTTRTKLNICPYYNPFDGVFPSGAEITLDVVKLGCVIVFENFVYCGINQNIEKLSFTRLIALTLVSNPVEKLCPGYMIRSDLLITSIFRKILFLLDNTVLIYIYIIINESI